MVDVMAFVNIDGSMVVNSDKIVAIRDNQIALDSKTTPVVSYDEPSLDVEKLKESFAKVETQDMSRKDYYNGIETYINPKHVETMGYYGSVYDDHVYVQMDVPTVFDEKPDRDSKYSGLMVEESYSLEDVTKALQDAEKGASGAEKGAEKEAATGKSARRLPDLPSESGYGANDFSY